MNWRPIGRCEFSCADKSPRRRGLSLLEVMLALAILAGTVAVTSELVHTGSRSAVDARDLTQAQLLCESKLAEINAGVLLPDPVNRAVMEEDPNWLYSVAVEQVDQDGLLAVEVIVEKNVPQRVAASRPPLRYRLVRWMVDPEYEAMLQAQAEEAAAVAQQQSASDAADEEASDAVP